ncbi:hypothetical protein Tco_0663470 [Tanacetum coccineum]
MVQCTRESKVSRFHNSYLRRRSCSSTRKPLPHQIPLPDTSDSDIETLFDHVDSNVFDTYTAPETDSAASSSNTVNIDVTPNNQLPHSCTEVDSSSFT